VPVQLVPGATGAAVVKAAGLAEAVAFPKNVRVQVPDWPVTELVGAPALFRAKRSAPAFVIARPDSKPS